MLVTTYQHDYVPPQTRRYEFTKKLVPVKEKEECECIQEQKIDIPKAALEKCDARVEWTGIAPMGKLIDPRLIPAKFSSKQIDGMATDKEFDCFKIQPNRFLKILRTAYPDLYERLKLMPKEELNRRLERERLFTTYQIDFCNMSEFPEGLYESLKEKDDTAKINATKLLQQQGPCESFRNNVLQEMERTKDTIIADPCEQVYKPFKIAFTDSSRFTKSGDNSHWRTNLFAKRPNYSEYMETIGRGGCIIMRNKLHDHSKCNGKKHCRHQIDNMCINPL